MQSIMDTSTVRPFLLRLGARAALNFAPRLVFGETAVFSRWEDVQEILRRDLDFVIEPVNKERIERVNGPFVLGMDRSATHLAERDALYKALRGVDLREIHDQALQEARDTLSGVSAGETIDAVNGYARVIASHGATTLLGIKGPDDRTQMDVLRALFHECFLNLGDDQAVSEKAVKASEQLRAWCDAEIARRRKDKIKKADMLGQLIEAGDLDDDGVRRTVSGMIVGAVDTTATCVAYIMAVILSRRKMLRDVRPDLDNPARMRGWCWEALRFWPHNPIVLRQAAQDTHVGGKKIKAGTTVVCFTLAAMHDSGAFPHPNLADPDRAENLYLHFGGGLHPCAGRAVNGVQIPLLVTELLRRAPETAGPMQFDGPFPDTLLLKLTSSPP